MNQRVAQLNYVVSMSRKYKAPGSSRLFYVMLLLSLLLHGALFTRIAEQYTKTEVGVIELSLDSVEKPSGRIIPKPHFRPKLPSLPKEIMRQQVKARTEHMQKPLQVDPVKAELPKNLMARIDTPKVPGAPSFAAADFASSGAIDGAGSQYGSAREYFDMVRMRIETNKKYPAQAKARHREGRVRLEFIIAATGRIYDFRIIKSSGSKKLDQAAAAAVEQSSPLPVPPATYFAGPVPVQLTIVFELL